MIYHLLNHFNTTNQPYAYTDIMFRAICAVLLGFFMVFVGRQYAVIEGGNETGEGEAESGNPSP